MKFGKNIQEQQLIAPNHRFMDYKALKKVIANDDFVQQLELELHACNVSYAQAVQDCRAGFQQYDEAHISRLQRLAVASASLEALRRCAMWNAIAVIKILKKRAKLGLPVQDDPEIWLRKQAFFSCEDFAELKALETSTSELLLTRRLEEIGIFPAKCPICLDDCVDPVELSCSHKFCWKCFVLGPVTSGEYRLDRCPICRAEQPLDPTSNFIIRPAPSVTKVEQTLATVANDGQAGVGYFCFVCFEPLSLKPQSHKTQCMHQFHRDCLAGVVNNQNPTCPICHCAIVRESWDKCSCELSTQSWLGACADCGNWSAALPPPEVLIGPGVVMPSLLHLETGFTVEPAASGRLYWSAVGPIKTPSL